MEFLIDQNEQNQSEDSREECTPKKENEENFDTSEYDYNKRLWF